MNILENSIRQDIPQIIRDYQQAVDKTFSKAEAVAKIGAELEIPVHPLEFPSELRDIALLSGLSVLDRGFQKIRSHITGSRFELTLDFRPGLQVSVPSTKIRPNIFADSLQQYADKFNGFDLYCFSADNKRITIYPSSQEQLKRATLIEGLSSPRYTFYQLELVQSMLDYFLKSHS